MNKSGQDTKRAGKLINDGGLVIFPTETVYGLGANALNEKAVKNIFLVKERPTYDPLIVHIDSLDKIDSVLIMTVEPGFGGQGYLPGSTEKIRKLDELLKIIGLRKQILIEVDGGIKLSNAREVIAAGADILVAGSAIFGTENPIQTIEQFKRIHK